MHRLTNDDDVALPVRVVIRTAWLLACRSADIFAIEAHDIHESTQTFRFRIRGVKQAKPGSRGHYKWLEKIHLNAQMQEFWRTTTPSQETTPAAVYRVLHRYGYSLHSMRRGVATRAARCGVPLRTIRDLLGHESVRTTRLYVEPTDRQIETRRLLAAVRRVIHH
jgi:integrase